MASSIKLFGQLAPAVMPTKPARMPLRTIERSGFLSTSQEVTIEATAPAAAAIEPAPKPAEAKPAPAPAITFTDYAGKYRFSGGSAQRAALTQAIKGWEGDVVY